MKKIILFFIIIVTISCKAQKKEPNAVLDKDGNLVGIANKDNFLIEPFNEWFLTNYDAYEVDTETIENIKPLLKEITIKVFMGTWCSDSRRDSPAFFKLMDFLKTQDIGTRVMYPPINKQPAYNVAGDHPISNLIGASGLWLPSAAQLSDESIDYICHSIKKFYG